MKKRIPQSYPVEVNYEGATHRGSYTISAGVVEVSYGLMTNTALRVETLRRPWPRFLCLKSSKEANGSRKSRASQQLRAPDRRTKPAPAELLVGAACGGADAALPLTGPCPGRLGLRRRQPGHWTPMALACTGLRPRKRRATGQRRIGLSPDRSIHGLTLVIKEPFDRLVEIRLTERRKQLEEEIRQIDAKAAATGMYGSGNRLAQLHKLLSRELEIRTVLSWEDIVRVHRVLGSSRSEGLAQDFQGRNCFICSAGIRRTLKAAEPDF